MASGGTPMRGAGAAQLYGTGNPGTAGGGRPPTNLGDILERVLDKGLVIAGDIQVNLLDIELLTIKLRLVIASLDTAREVGINWWENDPWLNAEAGRRSVGQGPSRRQHGAGSGGEPGDSVQELKDELGRLRGRISELESGQ
ncbi:MAG TPA: gas vesicle protein [Trebonia sp.]|nr:gas vesicle protein [Trebonia sp.]